MADADRCTVCGEIIPEGTQVCPICKTKEVPPMSGKHNDFYNSEGYPDPTAYALIKQENALEAKTNFLIKVLKFVANEAGYDVLNRIELKGRKTGRIFK